MKKIIQYVLMLTVSVLATSCYYDEMPPEPSTPIPDVVSYSKDIQPLWDQSCVSCHSPGKDAPDLTAVNSYNALLANNKYVIPGNVVGSKLHKSLIGDGVSIMPPPGFSWSDSKTTLVDKWINDGALNN